MCLIVKQPLRRSDVDHTVLPANSPYLPLPDKRPPESAVTCLAYV